MNIRLMGFDGFIIYTIDYLFDFEIEGEIFDKVLVDLMNF